MKVHGAQNPLNQPGGPVQILHRDLSTQNQLGMLLAVTQTMMGYLLAPDRETENVPGKNLPSGEARVAAENTFIKSCERIDSILEDMTRWTPEYQKRVEKILEEQHAKSLDLMATQQNAAAEAASPHFQYRPNVLHLEEGPWIAFLGDPNDEHQRILGIGDNPAEALKDFDYQFSGGVPDKLKAWLRSRKQAIENGAELVPYPQDQKQNEQHAQTVDDRRVEDPHDNEGPESNGS